MKISFTIIYAKEVSLLQNDYLRTSLTILDAEEIAEEVNAKKIAIQEANAKEISIKEVNTKEIAIQEVNAKEIYKK